MGNVLPRSDKILAIQELLDVLTPVVTPCAHEISGLREELLYAGSLVIANLVVLLLELDEDVADAN